MLLRTVKGRGYKILLLLLVAGGISSCKQTAKENNPESTLDVVTTTGFIRDAVENIGKDSVRVEALMGPGVDPHVYKATHGDLKKLRNADLVLYNGLHLEGKMGSIFEKFSRMKPVYPVAESIPDSMLLSAEEYQGAYDPHIWFDAERWQYAIKRTSSLLQQHDSTHKAFFEKNTHKYLNILDTLDRWVHQQIQTIPEKQRVLITAHDAFRYFGDAYDIKVVGLQGLSTTSGFGLKDVSKLVDFIIERKITAIFVESSVSERNINAVVEGCRQEGHPVKIGGTLYSDAMGPRETPEGTYTGMFKSNILTITKALK